MLSLQNQRGGGVQRQRGCHESRPAAGVDSAGTCAPVTDTQEHERHRQREQHGRHRSCPCERFLK